MCEKKKKTYKFAKMLFSTIKLDKGNRFIWIASGLLGMFFSMRISFIGETVTYFLEYNDVIMTVLLALLAIQVGAYALFQALLSKEIIILMFEKDNLLQKTNEEFIGTILLYFYAIISSAFTKLMVLPIPEDFCLFKSAELTNICAFALLSVFFTIGIRVILESRNFFINLYNLMVSNYYKIIDDNLKRNEKEKK